MRETVKHNCDECGVKGVRVDTLDGGILQPDGTLRYVPAGTVLLLAGRADGMDGHLLLCDDCAEERV